MDLLRIFNQNDRSFAIVYHVCVSSRSHINPQANKYSAVIVIDIIILKHVYAYKYAANLDSQHVWILVVVLKLNLHVPNRADHLSPTYPAMTVPKQANRHSGDKNPITATVDNGSTPSCVTKIKIMHDTYTVTVAFLLSISQHTVQYNILYEEH